MTINTVKYISDIETPTTYTGYLVNGTRSTDIGSGDSYEVGVDEWMTEGNIPDDAYTQAELDAYIVQVDKQWIIDEITAITVAYIPIGGSTEYTFSGSELEQAKMTASMQVLFGKGDTKTRNHFDVDRVKVSLVRDDFDNLLDLIEPIYEEITDV